MQLKWSNTVTCDPVRRCERRHLAPVTDLQASAVGYLLSSSSAAWGGTHIRQRTVQLASQATGQSA